MGGRRESLQPNIMINTKQRSKIFLSVITPPVAIQWGGETHQKESVEQDMTHACGVSATHCGYPHNHPKIGQLRLAERLKPMPEQGRPGAGSLNEVTINSINDQEFVSSTEHIFKSWAFRLRRIPGSGHEFKRRMVTA